jgi:hypothetical protein
MKTLIFFLICNSLCLLGFAQWYQVNSGTSETIRDMIFLDTLSGYAICSNGYILKTVDGGNNWNVIYQDTLFIGSISGLNSIVVTDDSVYCFGMNSFGNFHKLSFGIAGGTVSSQAINYDVLSPKYINNEIYFISLNNVLGLYKYNNNNIIQIMGGAENFTKIYDFLSVGFATIIKISDDFGVTWLDKQFTTNALSSGPYQSFYKGDDTLIAITQYPTVIHYSYDNGNSWNMIYPPDGYIFHFTNSKLYGTHLFVSTNHILHNDLSSLSFDTTLFSNNISKLYFINDLYGFAFGPNGVIYKTTNGGGTVGVNEDNNYLKKKINVYPNPADNKLIIEADEINVSKIEILNNQGKIIKFYIGFPKILDTADLKQGDYILRFYSDKQMIYEKLIIIK